MLDSDWSRQFLLRSDWLLLIVAIMTTLVHVSYSLPIKLTFLMNTLPPTIRLNDKITTPGNPVTNTVQPPLTATSLQRPLFFVPADKKSKHWFLWTRLYNGYLLCPQGGRCMEVRPYVEKQKGGDTSQKWQRRKRDVMRVERVAFLCY